MLTMSVDLTRNNTTMGISLNINYKLQISATSVTNGKYAICSLCRTKVQDAYSFKKLVLQNEERFIELYEKNVIGKFLFNCI